MEPSRRSAPRFATLVALLALTNCVPGPNDEAVCRAFAGGESHVEVIADGNVASLPGTHPGVVAPHEGFLLHLRSGCALLLRVETNVAFTGPVPLRVGERVIVKGEYEYEPLGGVIHWTHRALHGHHAGGYVEVHGRYYW